MSPSRPPSFSPFWGFSRGTGNCRLHLVIAGGDKTVDISTLIFQCACESEGALWCWLCKLTRSVYIYIYIYAQRASVNKCYREYSCFTTYTSVHVGWRTLGFNIKVLFSCGRAGFGGTFIQLKGCVYIDWPQTFPRVFFSRKIKRARNDTNCLRASALMTPDWCKLSQSLFFVCMFVFVKNFFYSLHLRENRLAVLR